MFSQAEPRVFGLPPGVDVPNAFVEGLDRRLSYAPPDAIARVTVFVNSGRMERRIRAALEAGPPRLLPRLYLVTELDAAAGFPDVPPALDRLALTLELTELVTSLIERQPDLAPRSSAVDLAESLAALLDEMQGEGLGPSALADLDVGRHAAHWDRSRAIVDAAFAYFGKRSDALPGDEAHRRIVAEKLVQTWADAPPATPVLVVGSTGSRGATRLLMEAVARLPQGALILPGFDTDQPRSVWDSLSNALAAEDHPQYRFRTLLSALCIAPSDVRTWSDTAPPDPDRNRLVSLALRPAPVTDAWRAEGATLPAATEMTAALSLLEAPGPAEEAAAIALRLRAAIANGKTAALVTPDRQLTRRVAAALDRWGLIPDDSGGVPLSQTAPGRLLRQVANFSMAKSALPALLALLKHPLTASVAGERGTHLRQTRDLELWLRRGGYATPPAEHLRTWALEDETRLSWANWLIHWVSDASRVDDCPAGQHAIRHRRLAEAIASGPTNGDHALWHEAAGARANLALSDLEAAGDTLLTPFDYARLLDRHLGAIAVTDPRLPHPNLLVLGTLEARGQSADLVVAAGLIDGVWPAVAPPDPWLNRAMRNTAGLLLPDRAIGLAAHDFQQAVAAPEVLLSRSVRIDGAETVPSRWLNRLTNLLDGLGADGNTALGDMRRRGAQLLADAAALDRPSAPGSPAPRPAPQPPVAMRPKELAVTGVERLARDPYAIYARHILRLRKLDPLAPTADARVRGLAFHEILEAFVRRREDWATSSDTEARDVLLTIASDTLASASPDRAMAAFWKARLTAIADRVIAGERARLDRGTPVLTESMGGLALATLPFRLTARPDRIDRMEDGRFALYDYKSGTPPTPKQVDAFDKQLVLEAALLERGAFEGLHGEVAHMAYIPLNSNGKQEAPIPLEREDGTDRSEAAWQDLHGLIAAYLTRDQGYTARRAPADIRYDGDYDHLSRFGEWGHSDPATSIPVGPPDRDLE